MTQPGDRDGPAGAERPGSENSAAWEQAPPDRAGRVRHWWQQSVLALQLGLEFLGIWALLLFAYAGLTVLGSVSIWLRILTVAATVALFLFACLALIMAGVYGFFDEDWANDFREDNILLAACLLLLPGTLVGGIALGLWWT